MHKVKTIYTLYEIKDGKTIWAWEFDRQTTASEKMQYEIRMNLGRKLEDQREYRVYSVPAR